MKIKVVWMNRHLKEWMVWNSEQMIQGGSHRRLKEVQERTDGQQEENILNGITSVAEQESDLTTIQSQPRTDGDLSGECVQAGRSSNTVPEPPASCPYSDLNTPNSTHTHAHTCTHKHSHRTYLEIGCLGLVHREPHKNSELQVIWERLSVNVKKNNKRNRLSATMETLQE